MRLTALIVAVSTVLAGARSTPEPTRPATTPTVFDDPALVVYYQETITATKLAALLHEFASDAFEGRETGTEGQHRAASWLAQQYIDISVAPALSRAAGSRPHTQDYMQPVPVFGHELRESILEVVLDNTQIESFTYAPREPIGSIYLASGTKAEVSGPVEFRGYDPADGSLEYQEYAVLHRNSEDSEASWVMSFAPEDLILPSEKDGAHRSTSVWPRLRLKTEVRANTPLPLGYVLIAPEEHIDDKGPLVASQALSVGSLSLNEPAASYPFPPVYVITPDAAAAILARTEYSLDEFRERVQNNPKFFRRPLDGLTFHSKIDFPARLFDTSNVVAWIEGVDQELKDEYVVVSSHYDHIGVNPLLEGDNIYNGADDNGSGTVAMLEIAEAFALAKLDGFGPRRSIVFIHFTGEEKGLLGSAHYADRDPIFPLESTVTNINIDMIGRFDPGHPHRSEDYVYVIGSRQVSKDLHEISERVNDLTGINIELDERFNSKNDPNRYYRRSDHWNFGKHGIPFTFFFTGSHEDYHRPGDEADKIEYDRMTRIARLVFATAWQVANQDERPEISGDGFN